MAFIRVTLPQDDTRRIVPFAGRRLALIIGNKDYAWKPLVNPVRDAEAVASTLHTLGFGTSDIHLVRNAGQSDLRRAVRQFVEFVRPGDLAFFYYSGHRIELRGNNYLLPIDLPADATEGSGPYRKRLTGTSEQHLYDLPA